MYYIEKNDHENPILNVISIKNDSLNFKSSIYPNIGATLQQLSSNGIEIIDGISRDENGLDVYKDKYNSAFLFPFPCRIPKGQYKFQDIEFELECNEQKLNNALHGHIHSKSFSVTKQNATEKEASITCSYLSEENTKGFPYKYQLDITYIFNENKLSVEFDITNLSNTIFPFGIGWHPYFKTNDLDKGVLNFEANSQLQFNEKMVPDGETPLKYNFPLEINDKNLDDGFILNKPNALINTQEYNVELNFSSNNPNSFLQVYIPPNRESIAVEPLTCAPNSFNNKKGLLTLEASNKYNWKIDLDFSTK